MTSRRHTRTMAWWAVAVVLTLPFAVPWPVAAQDTGAPGNRAGVAPARVQGRELTLAEAIAIALATEPSIQARLRAFEAAQFRVTQALAPILPQLTSSWTASRQKTQFFSAAIGGAGMEALFSTTTTARVTLSQILFDFGKTFAATDVARAEAQVSRLDAEIQKDQVILAVKEAYFNLLFAKRLVIVDEVALERAELNLKSAQGFFEVGSRPKSDVTRAEVDVANARVDLIRARNAVRLARVALNTAMGITVDAPTEVKDILFYQPYPVDQGQLLPEALEQRPEYARINAFVTGAEASLRRSFRDFFPDVSGFSSYGGTFRDPQRVTDLEETWELGVSLNWSFFEGGSRIARFREVKKSLEAARSRVQALELAISQEVVQAHLNLQETQERIGAAKKAVESAQENFRLAQGRFDAGVGTILELTDAQVALTQAQATEAQALTDYRIAIARMERALGRR
ncbi:MAG: TolC family protein [Candidatus Methylomirabilia bacterium]